MKTIITLSTIYIKFLLALCGAIILTPVHAMLIPQAAKYTSSAPFTPQYFMECQKPKDNTSSATLTPEGIQTDKKTPSSRDEWKKPNAQMDTLQVIGSDGKRIDVTPQRFAAMKKTAFFEVIFDLTDSADEPIDFSKMQNKEPYLAGKTLEIALDIMSNSIEIDSIPEDSTINVFRAMNYLQYTDSNSPISQDYESNLKKLAHKVLNELKNKNKLNADEHTLRNLAYVTLGIKCIFCDMLIYQEENNSLTLKNIEPSKEMIESFRSSPRRFRLTGYEKGEYSIKNCYEVHKKCLFEILKKAHQNFLMNNDVITCIKWKNYHNLINPNDILTQAEIDRYSLKRSLYLLVYNSMGILLPLSGWAAGNTIMKNLSPLFNSYIW